MLRMRRFVVLFALATAACGSEAGTQGGAAGSGGRSGSGGALSGGAAGSGGNLGGAGGDLGGAGGDLGGAGGGASGEAGAPQAGGSSGSSPQTAALETLGSLVVLGDSLSDGGGEPPYYYSLLRTDLGAKYGPIEYRNVAQSGSKTGALKSQIDALPSQLPGPVAVAITSGGNDMKASILQIVTGTDAAARSLMGANISNALDSLLQPGRFGAGVDVYVFETNIYDASDGQGNFSEHACAFGQGFPAMPTDGYFAAWNGEIATQIGAKSQYLIDLHELFRMHGFNYPPSWYASDCTHPTSVGHDELRRLFYFEITGETLP